MIVWKECPVYPDFALRETAVASTVGWDGLNSGRKSTLFLTTETMQRIQDNRGLWNVKGDPRKKKGRKGEFQTLHTNLAEVSGLPLLHMWNKIKADYSNC